MNLENNSEIGYDNVYQLSQVRYFWLFIMNIHGKIINLWKVNINWVINKNILKLDSQLIIFLNLAL